MQLLSNILGLGCGGGGGRYMGVEWAYFVLISLEFASYHSDAKRALCDTQIFVGNEWL